MAAHNYPGLPAGSYKEVKQYYAEHPPATPTDRWRAAEHLRALYYDYDLYNPPRLDRSAFSMGMFADQNGPEPEY